MGSKKLKILTVNVSDSSGGAARAAYRIHNAACEAGIDGKLLVKHKTLEDHNVIGIDSFDTLKSIKVPFRWIEYKIKNKLEQLRWRPYPQREDVFMSDLRGSSLHGALQKLEYDILHLHWINLRFVDLKELRKVNKPIVWTLHDCWPFSGICHYFYNCTRYQQSCGNCPFLHSGNENDLSHKVWKKKLKLYKGLNLQIVTPSNWLAEAARKSSLFAQFPVSVIPNPIDTNLFQPGDRTMACEALGLDPSKTYILYGAMNAINDRNKGFHELLQALKLIDSKLQSDVELIVFGANTPLQELQTKLKVHYMGYIQNDQTMISLYQAANVMVVPSLSENLSNVIMESMSCGTPVVAFDIGGNSDMIIHKENGYLARENDAIDLSQGIFYMLNSDNISSMKSNARNRVLNNYSREIVAYKYINLYKSAQALSF